MGGFSIWHWVIVLAVVLVLFGGGGKLSRLMGDAGSGINAFRKSLKGDGKDAEEARAVDSDKKEQPTIQEKDRA